MNRLETIKYHITQLDEKTFFAYLGGFLLGIMLIIGGIFYYYSSAVDDLTSEFEELNKQRQEVRLLLETAARVKKQEVAVDKILKEDMEFRIGKPFEEIITKLQLKETLTNKQSMNIETQEREGKYNENILHADFTALDMKQICELLKEIEDNERLYTISLEIMRSKVPTKLDVKLAIGTLTLKTIPAT